MENITHLLEQTGLSEKETQVYLTLIESAPSPASVVAKKAMIQRQTTYSVLESLGEMGIVQQSVKSSVKTFTADPRDLITFLEQRKEKTIEIQSKIKKEIPKLLEMRKSDLSLPKVLYYEGENGLKQLFEHILDYYKSGGEKIFRAYGVNSFKDTFNDKAYLPEFVKERSAYGVETRLFISKNDDDFGIVDEKTALGREIKRLGIEPQRAALYIVGDAIYLFSYQDKVGVMIENSIIISLFKAVFDDHWERIQPSED